MIGWLILGGAILVLWALPIYIIEKLLILILRNYRELN